jgi:hypothetical protein
MRRRHLTIAALAAAALAAGCASIDTLDRLGQAPWTPMAVAAWPGAPEGPFRAAEGERVLTQHLAPALLVTLEDEARPIGLRAPAAVAAGTSLFGVVDARGMTRYCAPDEDGNGRITCFEDVDGDSVFDRAWSGTAHDDFTLTVRRWNGSRALAAPAPYAPAAFAPDLNRQVAVRYLGRSRELYGFALQVGGPGSFADVSWTAPAAWVAPDAEGVVAFAGARFRVLETSRRGGVIYGLEAPLAAQPVTLQVSTATRTLDTLVMSENPRG